MNSAALMTDPNASRRRSPWQAWLSFGRRHSRLAALTVFLFGALVHAILSQVFATAEAEEIEALLEELYVFQCVPLEPVDRPVVSDSPVPRPTPLADQRRELDVTSVRVLFIERAVQRLGPHRDDAVLVVADVLRFDPDLNTRAGAVLALSYLGPDAAPAIPELLDTLADTDEDIRLRRLIVDLLPQIDPSPEAVASTLVAMLDTETDGELRSKVVKALTEMGGLVDR